MYYSAGTYEAFAHPEKPEGVDNKSAYIIGTGLAGLTAAFYLVRDGQMKGERIHLLEKLVLAGVVCGIVAACLATLGNPANMDMTIRTVSASANTFFIILLSFSFLTSRSWEVIDECIIARILFIVNRMNIQQ